MSDTGKWGKCTWVYSVGGWENWGVNVQSVGVITIF